MNVISFVVGTMLGGSFGFLIAGVMKMDMYEDSSMLQAILKKANNHEPIELLGQIYIPRRSCMSCRKHNSELCAMSCRPMPDGGYCYMWERESE